MVHDGMVTGTRDYHYVVHITEARSEVSCSTVYLSDSNGDGNMHRLLVC